ncbi:FAD:protein FMN transferase [Dermacoccaceae bacterium W4C1]
MERWEFEAIGTVWQIDSAEPLGTQLRAQVTERIEQFDADWSRFRTGSLPDRVRAGAGRHPVPADAEPMLHLYDRLFALTDGAVDPCVGSSLEQLGYDAQYSLRAGDPVASPSWSKVQREPGAIRTQVPFVLDVGAAGKGYLVDLVTELIAAEHQDVEEVTVDAGGDLRRIGAPISVALEHPFAEGMAVGVATVGGRHPALCASAINRRAWPGQDGSSLHHVLDPRTGRPVDEVVATWVAAADALHADALATALFFTPAQTLATEFDFDYAVITADGRLTHSPELPTEVYA